MKQSCRPPGTYRATQLTIDLQLSPPARDGARSARTLRDPRALAFADVNSDSSVGTVPIEPPVETSVTRTQERVETAFTCDLTHFEPPCAAAVWDSQWPREF
eukprot:COSAG02_NODE_1029_length_15083_cov_8.066271_1_plen_102_part_00